MITRQTDLSLCQDNKGMFFESESINLDEDTISVPCQLEDGTGVLEFSRRKATWHPANGKSKTMTVKQFLEIIEKLSGNRED